MTYQEFLNKNIKIAENKNKEKEAVKMLLLESLKISATEFYFIKDKEVENFENLQKTIDKYLIEDIPVQYILGYTYFYGLKFFVDKNVLIPRFDTEVLVEEVLNHLDKKNLDIVDIGTGSGCIAISIKKHFNDVNVDAIDISSKALNKAIENAKFNNVEVNFIENDLLKGIDKKYDVIISNPPYISYDDEISDLVYKNEPHSALFAENNGMYFYEEILKESIYNLNEQGLIFFEIGYNQRKLISELINKYYPEDNFRIIKDLSGNDRVVIIYHGL